MVRPATAADQADIHRIVRSAGINPFGLHWRRFVVADVQGVVVGTGQIRTHADGSHELASIAVTPAHRGRGVARAIIETLVEGDRGPLYLICRGELEPLYARFGFHRIDRAQAPTHFARVLRFAELLSPPAVRLGWISPGRLPIVMTLDRRTPP